MLYYLYILRDLLAEDTFLYKMLNVFKYTSFRGLVACLLALAISLIFGAKIIRILTALKAGQPIRGADEVHRLSELHGSKAGTPTMGGIIIVGTVLVVTLVCARWDNPMIWSTLFVMVALALLGFKDDYEKVKYKNSKGVSARYKILYQLVVATIGIGILLWFPNEELNTYISQLYVPFVKAPIISDMGIFMIPFATIIIIGCSNAVNLTDGLDGLASGCTLTVASAFTILAYVAGNIELSKEYLFLPYNVYASELAVLCCALIGACSGFLWYNCHPARVFMGDTGSLSIGGILAMIAICTKHEFLLVIIGGVFVIEALSVILQVGSFKLTGTRIFRMAPLHHHFELKGWQETQVIVRFWLLSAFFAILGLATLKLR